VCESTGIRIVTVREAKQWGRTQLQQQARRWAGDYRYSPGNPHVTQDGVFTLSTNLDDGKDGKAKMRGALATPLVMRHVRKGAEAQSLLVSRGLLFLLEIGQHRLCMRLATYNLSLSLLFVVLYNVRGRRKRSRRSVREHDECVWRKKLDIKRSSVSKGAAVCRLMFKGAGPWRLANSPAARIGRACWPSYRVSLSK